MISVLSSEAYSKVEPNGDNRILITSGANAHWRPVQLQAIEHELESSTLVVIQLEIPIAIVEAVIKSAKSHDVPVLLNPAPAVKLGDNIYKSVNYFVPNESEAALLSGLPVDAADLKSVQRAAHVLQGAHKSMTVIITLGSRGVYYVSGDMEGHIAASNVKTVVDTTAAGKMELYRCQ